MVNGASFSIHNICYVLALTCNLMSVGHLDDLGYKIIFHQQSCHITKGNMLTAHVSKVGFQYLLYVSNKKIVLLIIELPIVALWHSWLGHISKKGTETLSCLGYFPSLSFSQFPFYDHCTMGSKLVLHIMFCLRKRENPLSFYHSDICGPMPKRSLGGMFYFVTLINDATQKVWVYTLKSKDELFS